jgi:hypothetical protein
MARPRKPTALLELTGALRKDPQRYRNRANEPRPTTAIGEPPADFLRPDSSLAARHLRIWHELIEQAPPGVLTGCDRAILVSACRIQAAIECGKTEPAMFGQLRAALNDMGMTPVARSRVSGARQKPEAEDEWDKLAGEVRRSRAN